MTDFFLNCQLSNPKSFCIQSNFSSLDAAVCRCRPSVSPSKILLETTKGVGLNFELGLAYMNVDNLVMV